MISNSMAPWIVEKADGTSAEKISNLYVKVWKPYMNVFPGELMDDRMPKDVEVRDAMGTKTFFVVREGGKIIGVVRATIDHGACLLDRMVVDQDHQGRGVGKALTQHVIEYARKEGCHKVWLDTSPKLEEAVWLYKGMGFKECGFFKRHYWGTDICFYELLL